jgi:hypothetical protein
VEDEGCAGGDEDDAWKYEEHKGWEQEEDDG